MVGVVVVARAGWDSYALRAVFLGLVQVAQAVVQVACDAFDVEACPPCRVDLNRAWKWNSGRLRPQAILSTGAEVC